MALANLPRTMNWHGARAGWQAGAHTPAGSEGDAPYLELVDQRKLPHEFTHVRCFTSADVCACIADLTVRGAPALGVCGAYAMVLWAYAEWPPDGGAGHARDGETGCRTVFLDAFEARADEVARTRPTAVNLAWAIERMKRHAREQVEKGEPLAQLPGTLEQCAARLEADEEQSAVRMGRNGAERLVALSEKLGRPLNVQTHCNAGSLGTVRLGSATSAIYHAAEQGRIARVWVDETRPVDQGARLTTWEMERVGVPYTLICDDMAGAVMSQGSVDAVIVGADRVCANGDVANKIGTYQLAVLAAYHGIPFYVVAPESTFDRSLATGAEIVIEQRDAREVRCMPSGREWLPVALQSAPVYNPAFDVTPHELITEIVTD